MDYIDAPTTAAPYAPLVKDTLSMKAERLLINYRNMPKTSLTLAGLAGIGVLAILGGIWAGKNRLFPHPKESEGA
ncbi:hypothetical protein MMA231_00649 [Asticcacaulis sp. MM231]|uniref:hypothetical protein n=1 Tax=Asticcacaulis sp. MM231 TaxID=3157666 RepID=UPI0032D58A8D